MATSGSMNPSPCCIAPEGGYEMTRSRTPSPAAKTSTARSKGQMESTLLAKTATAASRGRVSPTPEAGRASVRMYRQGLGDCFLITLPKQDGKRWHMLIDCGVILGTKDGN